MLSMSSLGRRQNARGFGLPPRVAGGRVEGLMIGVPVVLMAAAVTVLTLYCRSLLVEAANGQHVTIGTLPLVLVAGGFLIASASVVLLQSTRVVTRVAGPELRLARAMQRIRGGDISFRVHLRRGDLLTDLARECNALLDWLNTNPPNGVVTGGDVVEVAAEVAEEPLVEVAP